MTENKVMLAKDYLNLATAVRNGMNMNEAIAIVDKQPNTADKAAFWNNIYSSPKTKTTISLYRTTKNTLKLNQRKGESYDDQLNRLIEESNEDVKAQKITALENENFKLIEKLRRAQKKLQG